MKAIVVSFLFASLMLAGSVGGAPDLGRIPDPTFPKVAVGDVGPMVPVNGFGISRQGFACRVTTDGGRLNIRSIPSTSGRIVGKLYNGTVVKEIGVRDDWSRIAVSTVSGRRGRVLGWVLSVYLVCGE